MRKTIHLLAAILLVTSLLCSSATALAESKYVSIKDIRATIPERWTGEYVTQKGDGINVQTGDTIFIDAPIVVPEVDTVPIVRITWGGPYETTENEEKIDIRQNDSNWCFFYHPRWIESDNKIRLHNVDVGTITYKDAPNVLLAQLRTIFPALQDQDFDCFYTSAYDCADPSLNTYQIDYYNSYHGIAYLIALNFSRDAEGECVNDNPPVPSTHMYGYLSAQDAQQFTAELCAPKEINIDVEDVPLLPFDEILKEFEQRVADGYIYCLDEMRFGYMAFIDPAKKGEEFVLMPVWAAKGRTPLISVFPSI